MDSTFTDSLYYHREQLFHKLDMHKSQPLIGLFASSGFGKTILIRSYLEHCHCDPIWLTAERLERSGNSLLSYLAEKAKGHGYAPDQAGDIFTWLEERSSPLYLVISRYQLLDSILGINDELLSLLEVENPYFRIILIGDCRPSLPLSRLKAKNLYYELDERDLSYTREELEDYFNHYCGLELEPYELDAIYDTTGGWPAGCHLISDFMQKNPKKSRMPISFRLFTYIPDLFDYLSNEVFDSEPEEVRNFMLMTSLMTELDPEIINEFLGIEDSGRLLALLEQGHSFVYKNDDDILQYHKLFRSFLYNKFRKAHAERLSGQHCKLAAIYLARYSYIAAFSHAVAGNDYVLATKIMKLTSDRYNPIQFINVIDGHLEDISSELHFSNTSLFLTRCIPEHTLQEFIAPLKDLIRSAEHDHNDIKLANLQNRLGAIYYHLGFVEQSMELFTSSSEHAAHIGDFSLLVCNLQLLADCHLFMNEVELSLDYAKQAIFIAEKNHITIMQIHTLEVMSRIHIALANYDNAEMYLSQAMTLASDSAAGDPFLALWLFIVKSRLLLKKGCTGEAIDMAQKAVDCVKEYSAGFDIAYSYLALADAYLEAENMREAERCYEIAHHHAALCGFMLYEILLRQLAFYQACGRSEAAVSKKAELADICRQYRYTWSAYYSDAPAPCVQEETADRLTIRTLGRFEILQGNRPITISRSSSIRLLQFLIINRSSRVHKDIIVHNIFPYEGEGSANHFNVALSVLRKSLEPGLKSGKDSKYILRDKHSYVLNAETVSIDLDELSGICAAIMKQTTVAAPSLVSRFHELYRGEFFEDYPYETFLNIERERINRQCMDVLRHIARSYKDSETPAKGIEYYERILEKEPYSEKDYLDYIELLLTVRAYHKAGEVADKMAFHIGAELNVDVSHPLRTLFEKYHVSYTPREIWD